MYSLASETLIIIIHYAALKGSGYDNEARVHQLLPARRKEGLPVKAIATPVVSVEVTACAVRKETTKYMKLRTDAACWCSCMKKLIMANGCPKVKGQSPLRMHECACARSPFVQILDPPLLSLSPSLSLYIL